MQPESCLLRLSVGSLDPGAAEPEDAAGAAAGGKQLLDDGSVLLLQRQHDCGLQQQQIQPGGKHRLVSVKITTSLGTGQWILISKTFSKSFSHKQFIK